MIKLFYTNKKIINILRNKLKNYWIKFYKKYNNYKQNKKYNEKYLILVKLKIKKYSKSPK